MENDVELHASASLMTLRSSIQADSKMRTRSGGYRRNEANATARNEYRDEKTKFK
jgi:hypothetical protein